MTDLDLSHVHITKNTASAIVLLFLGLAVLYLGYKVIAPFAGAMLMGAILAILFYPVHIYIHKRVRRASMAAGITTTLMLIAFLAPLAWLGTQIGQELSGLYRSLASGSMNGQLQELWGTVQRYGPTLGITADDLRSFVEGKIAEASGAVLQQGFAAVGVVTEATIFAFFSAVAFFFAVRDGHKFVEHALRWSPLGERHTEMLFASVIDTIFASFYGVVVVAAAQGLLVALGAWILGLPSPLLWGVATGIASVLPLFGSALVWVPAAGVLFLQGAIGKGLLMLIWGGAVVGVVDNILRPLVVTSGGEVNGMVMLIAMLGGTAAFGLAGILIGPLTVSTVMIMVKIIGERMHETPAPKGAGPSPEIF